MYIISSEENVGKISEDIFIRDCYLSLNINSEIITLKDAVSVSETSDLVILKSIWGYHLNYEDFLLQINRLRSKGVRLINDYDFIVWNIDKYKYLEDLKDLNIVPSKIWRKNEFKTELHLKEFAKMTAQEFNTDKLVFKPSISASGYLTNSYKLEGENDLLISSLRTYKHIDFIVQPYRDSISEGEISVIILNGEILYGVIRYPGVFEEKKKPVYIPKSDIPKLITNELLSLEGFFINKFNRVPYISRIDFLRHELRYEILEVELIDPDLFFRNIPNEVREHALSIFLGLVL